MKRFFMIINGLMMALIITSLSSCGKSVRSARSDMATIQSWLPHEVGPYTDLIAVYVNQGEKRIDIAFKWYSYEKRDNYKAYSTNTDLMRRKILLDLTNGDFGKVIIKDCIELNYSLQCKVIEDKSNQTFKTIFTSEDFNSINLTEEINNDKEYLSLYRDAMQTLMPIQIKGARGVELVKVKIENGDFVYIYEVSEEYVTIDQYYKGSDSHNWNIDSDMKGSTPKHVQDICKRNNLNIKFEFYGAKSGEILTYEADMSKIN